MTPFLQLALALAVIILAAKISGYLSYRLGQPSVLGELLVGIILGPSLLNLLHFPFFTDENLSEVIHQLAEIGVLLLMFLAGLDLHFSDVAQSGKVAVLAGIFGVVIPMALGIGTGLAFSTSPETAIFIGLALSATSVSISAQTLIELKALRSRVGIGLLGAAVFDDILVVLGLSVFIALSSPNGGNGFLSILEILLRMLLFLALASAIGHWLLPRLMHKVHQLPISQGVMALTFVIILIYGWLAEALGHMAAITGAFLAGLWLSRSALKDRIVQGVSVVAYGVFVPVFFVNVGLLVDARVLFGPYFWPALTMILVAIIGKVVGAGFGANLGGLSAREALQLGVGMMSRGEVGLIVASIGITEGLIGENVYASVVGVVIATTLLTPPLLRTLFVRQAVHEAKPRETAEGE